MKTNMYVKNKIYKVANEEADVASKFSLIRNV